MATLPRGLYAITPDRAGPLLGETAERVLAGGARVLQYRDKGDDAERRLREARMLAALCHRHDALLIVNDDVELAAACGADGVHLGRDDGDPSIARARLGDGAVIGISCYDSLELAESAAAAGADYVAFGSFFPSPTKPEAVRASVELLHDARRRLALPIVAIGGITPENGPALVAAGAHMLAVISGLFGTADPTEAARRYAALFG
ncbi:MAG TPA: thiamine phosphate synthase [Thiotrichales bacterium]|nr:thiamine phosphate synthase [Thiotrichales bacterium]